MNETFPVTALIIVLIIFISSSLLGWNKRFSKWFFSRLESWVGKYIPGPVIEFFFPSENYVLWISVIGGIFIGDWVGFSLIPRMPRQGIGELAFVLQYYISVGAAMLSFFVSCPILNLIPWIIEKMTPAEDPTGLKCPMCGRPKAAKSSKCLKCGYQF